MRVFSACAFALFLSFAAFGGSGSAKAEEFKPKSLIPVEVVEEILIDNANADDVAQPLDELVQWAVVNDGGLKDDPRVAAYNQAMVNMDFFAQAIVYYATSDKYGPESAVYMRAVAEYASSRDKAFSLGRDILMSYGRRNI